MNKWIIIIFCCLIAFSVYAIQRFKIDSKKIDDLNSSLQERDVVISIQEQKIESSKEIQEKQNDTSHTEKVKKNEDCNNMFVTIPSKCLRQ